MPTKILGGFAHMFRKRPGAAWCGEGRCEVEVQTRVNRMCQGHFRRPLRVRHENHGAHGRECPTKGTFSRAIRRLAVSAPIVGIDNEKARVRPLYAWASTLMGGRRVTQEVRLREQHS